MFKGEVVGCSWRGQCAAQGGLCNATVMIRTSTSCKDTPRLNTTPIRSQGRMSPFHVHETRER